MAEYINKNDIRGTGLIFTGEDDAYTSAQADGADKMWNKILSLPTVNAIPISEEATNGDIIKTMFPNTKIRWVSQSHIGVTFRDNQDYITEFELDWWDTPYKKNCIPSEYDYSEDMELKNPQIHR